MAAQNWLGSSTAKEREEGFLLLRLHLCNFFLVRFRNAVTSWERKTILIFFLSGEGMARVRRHNILKTLFIVARCSQGRIVEIFFKTDELCLFILFNRDTFIWIIRWLLGYERFKTIILWCTLWRARCIAALFGRTAANCGRTYHLNALFLL